MEIHIFKYKFKKNVALKRDEENVSFFAYFPPRSTAINEPVGQVPTAYHHQRIRLLLLAAHYT